MEIRLGLRKKSLRWWVKEVGNEKEVCSGGERRGVAEWVRVTSPSVIYSRLITCLNGSYRVVEGSTSLIEVGHLRGPSLKITPIFRGGPLC